MTYRTGGFLIAIGIVIMSICLSVMIVLYNKPTKTVEREAEATPATRMENYKPDSATLTEVCYEGVVYLKGHYVLTPKMMVPILPPAGEYFPALVQKC